MSEIRFINHRFVIQNAEHSPCVRNRILIRRVICKVAVCLTDVLVVFKAAAINLCKAAFTDHALNCIIGRNAKVIRTIIGLKLNHHFLVAGDDFFFYCYPSAAFELILQRRLKIVAPVEKVESFVRAAAGKNRNDQREHCCRKKQ